MRALFTRIPLLSLAAVAGLLALGGPVSPAIGATHTLHLSGPSTAVVGQPVVYRVSGTAAPPAEFWDPTWIDVFAIPASVVSACPPDDHSGGQLAEGTGGAILTIAMRPNKDEAGNFTNQVGATATAPGKVLICAYTVNEEGGTRSRASLTLSIRDSSGGGGPASPGMDPQTCEDALDDVAKAKKKVKQAKANGKKAKVTKARKKLKKAKRAAEGACDAQAKEAIDESAVHPDGLAGAGSMSAAGG